MRRIYEFSIVFFLSLAAGIVIFLPGLIPSGDVSQFATFVREIRAGGGAIPSHNTYYYPGSKYIYPPALFYLDYIISLPFVSGTVTYFYEYSLLAIAIVFSAFTSVLIYYAGYPYENRMHSGIAFILACLMGADIYSLPWGGYAYIVAQFFLIALLLTINRARSQPAYRTHLALVAILLTILISLFHDLTWALTVYITIIGAVYFRFKKDFFASRLFVLSAVTGSVVGAIWWIPRISFLLNTITLSYSQGEGVFQSIQHPFALVMTMLPSIVTLGVIIALIGISSLHSSRKIDFRDPSLVTAVMLVPFVIFIVWDEVITARILLYIFPLLSIFVCRNLPEIKSFEINFKRYLKNSKGIRVVPALLVGMLIVGPLQVYFDQSSVQFYSTGSFQYDQELVDYASNLSHFGNYTVLAPYLGQYLSSIDGVRVIMYEGFVFGGTQLDERNAAVGILENPNSSSSQLNLTKYNIGYIIIPSSWVNSTVNGVNVNLSIFNVVYSDQYYSVYKTNIVNH